MSFLCILGLQTADKVYSEKLQSISKSRSSHHLDKTMFILAWDVEELKKTHDECRKLINELRDIQQLLSNASVDFTQLNVSS